MRFLQARRIGRSLAVGLVLLAVLAILAVLVGTLIPMLIEQGRSLSEAAPRLLERLRESETIASLDRRMDLIGRAQRELSSQVGSGARPLVRAVGACCTRPARRWRSRS